MKLVRLLGWVALPWVVGSVASAQMLPDVIEVYPRSSAARASTKYLVEVLRTDFNQTPPVTAWTDAQAYQHGRTSIDPWYHQGATPMVHWATIGVTHSARVRVTDLTPASSTTSFAIQPDRYAIKSVAQAHVVEFTIAQGEQVYVRTDNQTFDTLFLFANPPAPPPPAPAPNVIEVPAGEWSFGPGIRLLPGVDTIYLDPGAWVSASVNLTDALAVGPVRIIGPGVLAGDYTTYEAVLALPSHAAKRPYILIHVDENPTTWLANDLTIDGPTLVASPFYNFELSGAHGVKDIRNVHIISPWTYNTDGFNVGNKANIENCFAFNNDDTIHGEYIKWGSAQHHADLNVSNCVFAGRNSFLIGYGYFSNPTSKYARITSCDVILQEGYVPFRAQVDGAPGVVIENQIYRDINVEGNVRQLFDLRLEHTAWGYDSPPTVNPGQPDPPNEPIYGNVRAITFENVELHGTQTQKSEIKGYDANNKIGYIEFRNLVINGVRITNSNQWQYFNIDWPTVSVNFR